MRARALAVMVGLCASVTLAGAEADRVAATFITPSELSFRALISAPGWSLTVTGPQGFATTLESKGGPPSLRLFNENGGPLPDGTYQYELRVQARAAKLRSADSLTDREA